ncbi:AsmA family protein [Beijerinckia sp. L45]|uniref:AsmA family protein n=1 Tax=Beijerinckia sp. L45 TaxID=1641855 RepID=UPI00131DBF3E|nr:AsmA family protein [Beijerinckia sp. L45]
MSERAQSDARADSAAWRWPALAALACLVVALAAAALAAGPYLFNGASLRSEIAEQVRTTTGLMLKADGPVRFKLLPQPHVEMLDLHFSDTSGALKIEATALEGEVRFLPLLVGRLEIASATLDHPMLNIDLDGNAMPTDSTIGRAIKADGASQPAGTGRLGVVTLVEGTAALKSKARAGPTLIEAINVTVDWRNLDAPASVTGTVRFKGVAADVAAWLGQPSSLLRGDHSAIALRIHSAPLDVSANGDLTTAPGLSFHGRLSAGAPKLADALALGAYSATLPAPFANVALTGDATIGGGALDLPNVRLRLDGNDYEGTLAYQAPNGRAALAGTLATEQLSLAPFLNAAPPMLDADRHWSTERPGLDHSDHIDLDLRISATHLRLPPFVIDDAALAVMTRDNRTEVALVEGKAYGGTLKGRASIGVNDTGLSLRATGSLNDADASALTWDGFGRQLAAGSLSISTNLESAGQTPRALMKGLHGWAKGRASDGEFSGVDFGHGLRELARQRFEAVLPALRNGRTPFDTLLFGLQIADGVATIDDGLLKGPDATLSVDGKADIGQRALDLHAIASTSTGDPAATTPKLRFEIGGTFDHPTFAPVFGGGLPPAGEPPANP